RFANWRPISATRRRCARTRSALPSSVRGDDAPVIIRAGRYTARAPPAVTGLFQLRGLGGDVLLGRGVAPQRVGQLDTRHARVDVRVDDLQLGAYQVALRVVDLDQRRLAVAEQVVAHAVALLGGAQALGRRPQRHLGLARRAPRLRDLEAQAVQQRVPLRGDLRGLRRLLALDRAGPRDVAGRPRQHDAGVPGGAELLLGGEDARVRVGVDRVAGQVEARVAGGARHLAELAHRRLGLVQRAQLQSVIERLVLQLAEVA